METFTGEGCTYVLYIGYVSGVHYQSLLVDYDLEFEVIDHSMEDEDELEKLENSGDDGGLEENMEVGDSGDVDYIEKSIEAHDTDDFQKPIDKDEGKVPSAPDSLSERKTDQICLNKEKHEEKCPCCQEMFKNVT